MLFDHYLRKPISASRGLYNGHYESGVQEERATIEKRIRESARQAAATAEEKELQLSKWCAERTAQQRDEPLQQL